MRRSFGAVKLYSIAAACGPTWRAFVTSCSTCSGGRCLRLPLSFKSKTTFAGTANASIKKPPLDRKSAQKWLTVLNYGQLWKSPKTPGVFIYGVLNYGVFIYGRFKLWPLQYLRPHEPVDLGRRTGPSNCAPYFLPPSTPHILPSSTANGPMGRGEGLDVGRRRRMVLAPTCFALPKAGCDGLGCVALFVVCAVGGWPIFCRMFCGPLQRPTPLRLMYDTTVISFRS